MSNSRHTCVLGLDSRESNFPPIHPKRFMLDRLGRKLRKSMILDVDDMRCWHFFPNNKCKRNELRRNIRSPYHFVIHPFSKMKCILEFLFVILILWRYVTLAIDFDGGYPIFEIAANVLWLCFMITFFLTGYVDYTTKEIYIHPRNIVKHYLKTYFFFDFIVLNKTLLRVFIKLPGSHAVILLLAVISYLARFKTVCCEIQHVLMFLKFNKFFTFGIYHFLKLIILLHFITSVYVIAPSYIYSDQNYWHWLGRTHGKYYKRFELYTHSCLLILCNFFGIHYDLEVVPPIQEIFILFLIRIVGRLYTLELITQVFALFGLTNIAESEYEHHVAALKSYIGSKKLPGHLKRRILSTYEKKSRKEHFDEQEIMSNLTERLGSELSLFESRSLINKNSMMNRMSIHELTKLFDYTRLLIFSTNDVIVKEGMVLDSVYFISSGTVAGYNDKGDEIIHLEDGDEFGLSCVLFNQACSKVTWVAIETTEVFCIEREILSAYLETQPSTKKLLETRLKEQYIRFYDQEGMSKDIQNEVLRDLREGKLLEKPNKRMFAEK
ncbi:hypothetical protein JTB14_006502 [Gonioctena quinquepunctata]|nr:hypothetical protein JTB14_006502 [Gonioctena quinquepunctata]